MPRSTNSALWLRSARALGEHDTGEQADATNEVLRYCYAAKGNPKKTYMIKYIVHIEGNISYAAIEGYLRGLGYNVARRTLRKVVDKTLENKALRSPPSIRDGGHSQDVVLPKNGR